MEKLHDGEMNRALWYGCPERRFFMYGQGLYISGLLTGDYLLDDLKTTSVAPVYGHEKAIALITAQGDYYYDKTVWWLMYHLMSPLNVSHEEAERICRQNGCVLPELSVLQKLKDALAIVNNSLKLATGGGKQIAEDVLNEYWYKNCSPHERRYQKRKLLIFTKQRDYYSNSSYIGHCNPYIGLDGFDLVHMNYGDMYWVLQRVGKWYYALEDRMRCFMYNPQDITCNGYMRPEEDGTLIIANPDGATYDREGQEVINVYENFYLKDDFGIYRRHGYRLIQKPVFKYDDNDY